MPYALRLTSCALGLTSCALRLVSCVLRPMVLSYTLCLVPCVLYPMVNILCFMSYASCFMSCVLCLMSNIICVISFYYPYNLYSITKKPRNLHLCVTFYGGLTAYPYYIYDSHAVPMPLGRNELTIRIMRRVDAPEQAHG